MTLYIEERLLKRKMAGNLRELQPRRHTIDFSSNDYLGLAQSPHLIVAITHEWGTLLNQLGSTGSRLLTGNSAYAQDLENRLAKFHGYEAGLLFNCGYMANVGLLSTIANSKDTILFDTRIHASLHDGIRLSQARALPFRHNSIEHLEHRLKNCSTSRNRFICVESIYSTDGSLAPLSQMVHLAGKYAANLIVDEAHAIGVRGPQGRGLVAEYGLTHTVFAQVSTFGKSLGIQGAIVLGGDLLKQALINFASSFIYTTALPFYSLAAIKCSYDLFPGLELERKRLRKWIDIFQEVAPHSSATQIQPIFIKGNERVKQIGRELNQEGFDVRPLLSPTVQKGHEMLRICLHAFNTEIEVRTLLERIIKYV